MRLPKARLERSSAPATTAATVHQLADTATDHEILIIDREERVTILPGILPDSCRVIWHPSHGRAAERFHVMPSGGQTVLQAVTIELRRRRVAGMTAH